MGKSDTLNAAMEWTTEKLCKQLLMEGEVHRGLPASTIDLMSAAARRLQDLDRRSYDVGDIVECHLNGIFLSVTGIITDEGALFVQDDRGDLAGGREHKIYFCEVSQWWKADLALPTHENRFIAKE